jgi:hypothetical protein
MRFSLQFPLLALLCVLGASALVPPAAVAGSRGVTPPDSSGSGLDNTFGPNGPSGPPSSQMVSERIYNGMRNELQTIQQRGSVASVGNRTLPISTEQIARIESLLLGSSDRSAGLAAIQQQLSAEMGGAAIELSPLGNSANDLQRAIESANTVIKSLNREQLAAAAQSPTFMALLKLLKGGKEALNAPDLDALFEEGGSDFSLLQMSLASESAPEAEIPEVSPVLVQPRPEPAFQQPVRGLW